MRRIVWIPSGALIAACLGYAMADTSDLRILQTPDEAVTFHAPEDADRLSVSYRLDGDDAFSDVAVSTVQPFSGDAVTSGLARPAASSGRGFAEDRQPERHEGAAASHLAALAAAGNAKAQSLSVAEVSQKDEAVAPHGSGAASGDGDLDVAHIDWQSKYFADNPLVGSVFGADGSPSSESALMGAASGARYLLLGEIHDNPDHHQIQADIVGGLAKLGERPSVVFEMIPQGLSDVVSEFQESKSDDLSALAEKLGWSARGWPDFSSYRPIFENALANGLPIRAGDLDRATIRALGQEGAAALDDAEIARLALDKPVDPKMAAEIGDSIRQAHCGLMPEAAIEPMALVQRARDGALANAMVDAARETGSAVLITGSGHARKDRAVPSILRQKDPAADAVSVQMVEVADGEDKPADYGLSGRDPAPYDFTIFTPRADVTDHCAALREAMKDGKGD